MCACTGERLGSITSAAGFSLSLYMDMLMTRSRVPAFKAERRLFLISGGMEIGRLPYLLVTVGRERHMFRFWRFMGLLLRLEAAMYLYSVTIDAYTGSNDLRGRHDLGLLPRRALQRR